MNEWMDKITDFFIDSLINPEPDMVEAKLEGLEDELTGSQLPTDVHELLQMHFFKIRLAILVARNDLRNLMEKDLQLVVPQLPRLGFAPFGGK